jgi:hypothetical protein
VQNIQQLGVVAADHAIVAFDGYPMVGLYVGSCRTWWNICRRDHIDCDILAGGQQRQSGEQRRARQKAELQAPYKQFILKASKLCLDALDGRTELSKLVDIDAMLNRIRVLSSPTVIEDADATVRVIVDTYSRADTKFSRISHAISEEFCVPLRACSKACHEELRMD